MAVGPRWPTDLTAQARTPHACPRVRGLATPGERLRAVRADVLGALSTRRLGAWAVLSGLADLSEAAWRQRHRACHPWWRWLLSALGVAPRAVDPPHSSPWNRVLRVEASPLRPPGGTGDAWRRPVADDCTAGRREPVRVTARDGGASLVPCALEPGDIAVADTGAGARTRVASARRQQADAVRRVTPATCPLETAPGAAPGATDGTDAERDGLSPGRWGAPRHHPSRHRVAAGRRPAPVAGARASGTGVSTDEPVAPTPSNPESTLHPCGSPRTGVADGLGRARRGHGHDPGSPAHRHAQGASAS